MPGSSEPDPHRSTEIGVELIECPGIRPSQKVTDKTPNPELKPHTLSPFLLQQLTAGHHNEQGNAGKFLVTS